MHREKIGNFLIESSCLKQTQLETAESFELNALMMVLGKGIMASKLFLRVSKDI